MSEPTNELVVTHEEAASPMSLINLAIKSNADVATLEKLMDLQERWDKSQAAKAFKSAMVEFQGKKPKLIKEKQVDFTTAKGRTNYKYNPISKIQAKIDPVLSSCGLSYSWKQNQTDSHIEITCIVSHVDGHTESISLKSSHDLTGNKNPIQSIGSTITYLKRYTLECALGLSSDNDDDGAKSATVLPELTPADTRNWNGAIKRLLDGTGSIEKIETYFRLSEENRNLLWDVLHKQLQEAFEKCTTFATDEDVQNVRRIIDNKETLSYKKALDIIKDATK